MGSRKRMQGLEMGTGKSWGEIVSINFKENMKMFRKDGEKCGNEMSYYL